MLLRITVFVLGLVQLSNAATTPEPEEHLIGVEPGSEPAGCSDKKPCPDKNSQCVERHCLCNEGFAPIGNDTCIKSPNVGDVCRVNGQEFSCSGFGVDTICPPNNTVCECKLGFEPDPANKDQCRAAERFVGAVCKVDGDCTAAFTLCKGGKCACREGFKVDKNLCTPLEYKCFGGQKALQENGKIKTCETLLDRSTGLVSDKGTGDNCPPTHFCFHWQDSYTPVRNFIGHCCPKPTDPNVVPVCPIGNEHKVGKCPDLSQLPQDTSLPSNIGPLCPSETHECYKGRVCCPLACLSSSSHFNANGRCYDTVINDQPCQIDGQCLPNAECRKGTCQCKAGFTKLDEISCIPNPPGK